MALSSEDAVRLVADLWKDAPFEVLSDCIYPFVKPSQISYDMDDPHAGLYVVGKGIEDVDAAELSSIDRSEDLTPFGFDDKYCYIHPIGERSMLKVPRYGPPVTVKSCLRDCLGGCIGVPTMHEHFMSLVLSIDRSTRAPRSALFDFSNKGYVRVFSIDTVKSSYYPAFGMINIGITIWIMNRMTRYAEVVFVKEIDFVSSCIVKVPDTMHDMLQSFKHVVNTYNVKGLVDMEFAVDMALHWLKD